MITNKKEEREDLALAGNLYESLCHIDRYLARSKSPGGQLAIQFIKDSMLEVIRYHEALDEYAGSDEENKVVSMAAWKSWNK